MSDSDTGYLPLQSYGLIGDCHTAALISNQGSIDWLCMPRFDSPSIFARILDCEKGGHWSIHPSGDYQAEQEYVPNTNVLETRFTTSSGKVRLFDFMAIDLDRPDPTASTAQTIYRVLEGVEGEVELVSECRPRPDYARDTPAFKPPHGDEKVVYFQDFVLAGPSSWERDDDKGVATQRVTLHKGRRAAFTLEDVGNHSNHRRPAPAPHQALQSTETYWREWAARCSYNGPYRNAVVRSALSLRLLHYTPTGAIVAAPTTSLPEEVGGERNWDYRFAWLRDAAFTLYSLLLAGYADESAGFFTWIVNTVKLDKTGLRILYPVTPDGDTTERTLDYLDGYRHSRPVRIGNGAVHQLQLDVFGEVMDALHFAWKAHGFDPSEVWPSFCQLADWVSYNWRLPGSGIWEVRGGPRNFVYGKVMCWVALDRAIKLAEGCKLRGDTQRWARERDTIRKTVFSQGWSDKLKAFKQAFETDRLDAAILRMPIVGFIDGDDPRMLSTIDAIKKHLAVDGLCYRYLDAPDGVPGGENCFVLCTFWLIDALLLAGRDSEAEQLFNEILGRLTPLGLFSEEIDPTSGDFLGNYPQAFSQIGIISAAVSLAHAGTVGQVASDTAAAASRAGSGGGGQGAAAYTSHEKQAKGKDQG